MDAVTHVALGAILAEVQRKPNVSKCILLVGSLAQLFPDIDGVGAFVLSTDSNLLFHRGITHSLLAVLILPPVFAGAATKLNGHSYGFWWSFFSVQYAVHIFVDLFNAYGVGLLEPFSGEKYSWHSVYVADIVFMLVTVTSAIVIFYTRDGFLRQKWAFGALILCAFYMLYAVRNKIVVNQFIKTSLYEQHISYQRLLTTPTPFNSWLWYAAAECDSGYFVTHRSIYDKSTFASFTFVPRNDTLLVEVLDKQLVANLMSFSDGYFVVQQWGDTLVFNNLQFGQIHGWNNPAARFAFHYYLNYPAENTMVMQRGRATGWTLLSIKALLWRIIHEEKKISVSGAPSANDGCFHVSEQHALGRNCHVQVAGC
jgi:inner membrane protein